MTSKPGNTADGGDHQGYRGGTGDSEGRVPRQSILLAAEHLIFYARSQGWRDPLRVILWAAALLYHRNHRAGGWLVRCQRIWREVLETLEREAP